MHAEFIYKPFKTERKASQCSIASKKESLNSCGKEEHGWRFELF